MRKLIVLGVAGCIASGAFAGIAMAADGVSQPIKPSAKDHPLGEIWSGRKWASSSTQAMQEDDFANPSGPWLEIGEGNWDKAEGDAGKACASCHQDAASSMKGVATRYPEIDKKSKKLIALEERINNCRVENMKAKPWKWESNQMLGMMIFVKSHSRGMPMSVKVDGDYKKYFDKGKEFYYATARPARYGVRTLPRNELRQSDSCRGPEPGSFQRFPNLSPEVAKAGFTASSLQGVQRTGSRQGVQAWLARIHGTGTVPRLAWSGSAG